MGSNQVKESCGLVMNALVEYGGSVEGSTLSDICRSLGLTKVLRGNNFTNAVEVLKSSGDVLYSVRTCKKDRREYRMITLSLP